MSNVIRHPAFESAPTTEATPPAQEVAFLDECLSRFRNRHAARSLVPQYTNKCIKSLMDLMAWAGTPLHALEEHHYEAWCAYLANDRKLERSTQRTYQKHVRQVNKYLYATADLQNQAQRVFGRRLTLFAHTENSIIHTVEHEGAGKRVPMTEAEIDTLFDSLDTRIAIAEEAAPRQVRALKRDKAVLYLMYVTGVRVSEVGALDVADWRSDPTVPELGKYAVLSVRGGKGAKGSGKRHRLVPNTDLQLFHVMCWYASDVRPQFEAKPDHAKALFLSEQGKRLSASSIQNRLAEHLEAAGLAGRGFSPHSLRRSMVSHETARTGIEFVREKAGHADTHTTLIYGQVPKEYHQRKHRQLIRSQVKTIKAEHANAKAKGDA